MVPELCTMRGKAAMNDSTNETYGRWLDELASRPRFGPDDLLGSANLIDAAARQRAAESMVTGTCMSLARPIVTDVRGRYSGVEVEGSHGQIAAFTNRPAFAGIVDVGSDWVRIGAHGQQHTHLDSLNHIGRAGHWYNGFSVDDPAGPSLAYLADHLLVTRGVLVDIPAVRGTDWVDAAAPVTGEDIDAALQRQGAAFAPGDALLLYMGRDRYERAGHHMDVAAGRPTPGAGSGAARWIAEHDVSVLAWDFQDAVAPDEPVWQVHLLIWAIGLLVVDNCDLGPAAAQIEHSRRSTGGFIVTAPAIPHATGAIVQPLFIQ
jgi:kynurenine formamidase